MLFVSMPLANSFGVIFSSLLLLRINNVALAGIRNSKTIEGIEVAISDGHYLFSMDEQIRGMHDYKELIA
jgi:hypothetical protein